MAALDIKTEYGKKFDLGDEGLAWVGVRLNTMDAKEDLKFRIFDFRDALTDASKPTYKALRSPNIGSYDDVSDAVEKSQNNWDRAWKEMLASIKAAKVVGMTEDDIRETLKSAKVAQKHIPNLLRGETSQWEPYHPTIKEIKLYLLKNADDRDAMSNEIMLRIEKLNTARKR
jgi:hypothetical protein